MKPRSYLMTGSRASLASIGRLARRGGSKRRRLDAEVPVVELPDVEDAANDDVSDELRHRLQAQVVGPFGTAHDDVDMASGASSPSPASVSGGPRGCPRQSPRRVADWWPHSLWNDDSRSSGTPMPSLTSPPSEGESSSSSRVGFRVGSAVGQESDGGYSSQDSCSSEATTLAGTCAGNQREQDWSQMPAEILVAVFKHMRMQDLGRCAQVCRRWRRASQEPCLWRRAEFVLGSALRPEPTPPALVNFILEEHAQHLKFVVLRTDSSTESARGACRILARLVKCSLKTLALMSGAARPSSGPSGPSVQFEQQFASALTLVLDHSSPSLRALAVDHSLVDDPSLQALASSANSATSLQLLRCKGCPRLSPGGVLALVDHCRCLRELSLSYTLLSDDLLNALSSERHVSLEVLRVDVYTDENNALRPISPSSWRALVTHSPQLNLVMYLFDIQDESFDHLFTSYMPVTHLYFGDYVPTSVLSRVGAYCPRLVELVVGANGNSVIDAQLLDVASNCQQLSSLGLAECHVTCSALVRLAETCGPRLGQLVVMEECLIEDAAHDVASACARVSEALGRDWSPEFMPMW